jgi:hypothetical protein
MSIPSKRSQIIPTLFAVFCFSLCIVILGPQFPGRPIFFSLILIAVSDYLLGQYSTRYNTRHPQAPICLWRQNLYLATFILFVAVYNFTVGNAYCEVLFGVGFAIAALAVYYFVKDRSKTF